MTIAIFSVLSHANERVSDKPQNHVGWESAFVESKGIRLHYWRTGGENKPVMILAHGITDYGLSWASLAEKFQNNYDIIMYDARGHGYSDKPKGPYDLATQVEDLKGLIDALRIQKPILMGHCLGGGMIALFAATYPDLPRAIILENPAPILLQPPFTQEIIQPWKKMVAEDRATNKEKLMEMARTKRRPGWAGIEYERWAESKQLVVPDVVDVVIGKGWGNPKETYPKIMVPTLILKSDYPEDEWKKYQKIAALLPQGKLIHVEGAGLLIRLDKTEITIRLIREFLTGIN